MTVQSTSAPGGRPSVHATTASRLTSVPRWVVVDPPLSTQMIQHRVLLPSGIVLAMARRVTSSCYDSTACIVGNESRCEFGPGTDWKHETDRRESVQQSQPGLDNPEPTFASHISSNFPYLTNGISGSTTRSPSETMQSLPRALQTRKKISLY